MPVWPKTFYTFGINVRTAAIAWKLRQGRAAAGQQERAWAQLIPALAAGSYWKQAGIEKGMRYADFQARVPLQTHPRLAGAIDRMTRGEGDVLWPGRCVLFAQTSGTTTGERRLLPMTEELLQHHRSSGRTALLYYTARTRHVSAFRGRHLLLGGATTLAPIEGAASGVAAGELSGLMPLSFPKWVDRHLYEPGVAAAGAANWDERLAAIISRLCASDITLLAGLPAWVLELAERALHTCASEGRPLAHLQQLWPNLECVVHTGTPVSPFAPQLRAALGPSIKFHEVYAATEAFVATQDSEASQGLRLMTDGGVFFEFLPMSELDNERAAELGPKAVPFAGVKTGVDYALLLTTPGGLARYLLGDVVRFVSTEPPRLVPVGGTLARLNTYGENITEREVTQALVSVCDKYRWAIVNFHLSVLSAPTLTGQ